MATTTKNETIKSMAKYIVNLTAANVQLITAIQTLTQQLKVRWRGTTTMVEEITMEEVIVRVPISNNFQLGVIPIRTAVHVGISYTRDTSTQTPQMQRKLKVTKRSNPRQPNG